MIRAARLFPSSLLALAFAASAWAGTVSAVPQAALAPLALPPLILGGPLAPPAALSSSLRAQTLAVAALPPAAIAPYLVERAAAAPPVERAAAKLLAASIARNPAAEASSDPDVRALADSAKTDPALAGWFDGTSGAPALELDGLTLKRGTWRRGDAALDRLGRGEFGFVDAHPSIEGAVMKTVEHSAAVLMMSAQRPETTAAGEKETADLLASVDAGPRHFGGGVVGGRLISVRERVYGDTLERLFRDKGFGAAEQALVMDLLRRMAGGGVMTNDLRPANIMIGRTLLDPRRRAYVIDGGSRLSFPEGLDADARLEHALNAQIVLRGRFDVNVGFVEYTKSLARMMEEGRERAARVTRWQKLKGFLKDLAAAAVP